MPKNRGDYFFDSQCRSGHGQFSSGCWYYEDRRSMNLAKVCKIDEI